MKKIITLLLLIIPIIAYAQFEQSGKVRKQTFDSKSIGKPITGVIITPYKGNKVESKNGTFNVIFNNKKINDTASILSINKQGFRLVSTQYLRKGGIVLSKAPIEIIMGDIKEQKLDALKTYNNIIGGYKTKIKNQDSIIEEQQIKINNLIKEGKEKSDECKKLTTNTTELIKELNDLKTKINDSKFSNEIQNTADSLSKIDIQSLNEIDRTNIILKKEGRWNEYVIYNKSLLPKNIDNIEETLSDKIEQDKLELKKKIDLRNFIAERYISIAEGYKRQFKNDSATIYYIKLAKIDKTNRKYQMECGRFLANYIGRYNDALHYYERSLRLSQEQFGEKSQEASESYYSIGWIYVFKEDYSKALEYLFKSLTIEDNLENDDSESSVLYRIGRVYYIQRDYSNALEYFYKSLAIIEKNLVKDANVDVLTDRYVDIIINIGEVYYNQGNYPKALELKLKSLAIIEKEFDNDTSVDKYFRFGIDDFYHDIGIVYFAQGDYDKALEYYFKALKIRENTNMDSHRLAHSYKNIGLVYYNQGDYQKAFKYLLKSSAIIAEFEAFFLKDDSILFEYFFKSLAKIENDLDKDINVDIFDDYVYLYDQIGRIYYSQRNYSKALDYFFKSLSIIENNLDKDTTVDIYDSLYVDSLYNGFKNTYFFKGYNAKALEYYFKTLTILEKILGKEHITVALYYKNIGCVYDDQGDYDKALEYYFKTLTILEKLDYQQYTLCYFIGQTYFYQGNYPKALEYYFKSLTMFEGVLVKDYQFFPVLYNDIGSVYYNQGDLSKALEYYFKSLAIIEKYIGKNMNVDKLHWIYVDILLNIGKVYYVQGDNTKALEYLQKAYDIRKVKLGEEHSDTKSVLKNINEVKLKLEK